MTARLPVFYRIDSAAVSLREYWWGTRSPAILFAGLLKLLRVRIPSATDDPNVESLAPFEIDAAAVPADVSRRLEPLTRELEALGFRTPVHHAIADDFHHVRTHLMTFVHESGRALARIHNRVWAVRTPPKDVLFVEYLTPFTDGRFLWSLSSKPDLAAPPSCAVVRRTGASAAQLWAAHDARLRQEGAARRSTVPIRTADDLRTWSERHHAAVRNFHLRRGVFVPMSVADRQAAAANAQTRAAAEASGAQFPLVLTAMQRLQDRKSSWTTGLLILLVSAALFVGAGGSGGWSLESLAILVPVLLFHELGHWVAMRGFGYRNLQMFFIPFLGAAVTGRHYNVPGWKKAVVSLMGPMPGIGVGAALGVAGLILHQPLLLRVALTALVLNGLNLLPILPLDGGWVVQAVLGSRSVAFAVFFRVIAIGALLAWGVYGQDRPITFLGVLMLIGLPAAYRLARITRDLRRSGLEPASPDDQTIPVATAEVIIAKVVEAFPKRTPTNQVAQHTLDVFESLNARPPGALASLGLAIAQAGSLVVAVAFAALVAVGQHGSLGGLARAAQSLPEHRLDPASLAVWRSAPGAEGAPHNVVIATFETPAAARGAALDLEHRGPTRSALATFGETLLVALPAQDDAGREQWLTTLRATARDVFVATPRTPAGVQLACLASSADGAAAIEEELRAYFKGGPMRLIPPWLEADARTAEQAAHERARAALAASGLVSREGLLVSLPFVRFENAFEGPPAAVRWLQARGCGDFRYHFGAGEDAELGEEEAE